MTDLIQQQRAQEFSLSMFGAIGNAVTLHFLTVLEKNVDEKKAELAASDKEPKEKDEELEKFGLLISQNAHQMIRRHTALIVGGFTADMFPGLMPKEEASTQDVAPEEVQEQVFGVAGVPSAERVMQ